MPPYQGVYPVVHMSGQRCSLAFLESENIFESEAALVGNIENGIQISDAHVGIGTRRFFAYSGMDLGELTNQAVKRTDSPAAQAKRWL